MFLSVIAIVCFCWSNVYSSQQWIFEQWMAGREEIIKEIIVGHPVWIWLPLIYWPTDDYWLILECSYMVAGCRWNMQCSYHWLVQMLLSASQLHIVAQKATWNLINIQEISFACRKNRREVKLKMFYLLCYLKTDSAFLPSRLETVFVVLSALLVGFIIRDFCILLFHMDMIGHHSQRALHLFKVLTVL